MQTTFCTTLIKKYFSEQIRKVIPVTYALLAVWLIYRGVNSQGLTLHGAEAGETVVCVTE
ncbi:MAG: hypothetical protein NXI00_09300 [Cytophagales bacterium]|nr:hypothetical protein [Cytophagales bacterium]